MELLQGLSKQEDDEQEANDGLRTSLAKTLGDEVRGMNPDNFIVKLKRETVGRFQEGGKDWERLSSADYAELEREVAGLPSEVEMDVVEARLFDLKILRLQVGLVEENGPGFEAPTGRMEVAGQLRRCPRCLRWRRFFPFSANCRRMTGGRTPPPPCWKPSEKSCAGWCLIEKAKQTVIYTNFEDEIGEAIQVEETQAAYGGINLERFRQKTTEFLQPGRTIWSSTS